MDKEFFHYNPDADDDLEDVDYRRPRHEKEEEKRKSSDDQAPLDKKASDTPDIRGQRDFGWLKPTNYSEPTPISTEESIPFGSTARFYGLNQEDYPAAVNPANLGYTHFQDVTFPKAKFKANSTPVGGGTTRYYHHPEHGWQGSMEIFNKHKDALKGQQ